MVTEAEESAYIRQSEKKLRGYREFPNGRDFRCFKERDRTDLGELFEKRFDDNFPDAPGSPAWWEKKFKDKRR